MASQDPEKHAEWVKELSLRYGLELRRYLDMRGAGQDAPDVIQEVWLRLLKLSKPSPMREPVAYLRYVGAQVLGKYRRLAAKRPDLLDHDALERAAHQAVDETRDRIPEHYLAEREVDRVMSSLGKRHAEVLVLQETHGHTIEEIAAKTQMSVHMVRRYLVGARKTLKEIRREGTDI